MINYSKKGAFRGKRPSKYYMQDGGPKFNHANNHSKDK